MPPTSVSLQTHSSHSLPFNFSFLLAKWQMRVWKDLPADHLTKWNATRNATGSNCFLTDSCKALYFDRYTKLLAPAKAQVQDAILSLPDVKCCFCRHRKDGAFDFGCQSHHAFSGPKMPKYLAGASRILLYSWYVQLWFCTFDVIWSRDLYWCCWSSLSCHSLKLRI